MDLVLGSSPNFPLHTETGTRRQVPRLCVILLLFVYWHFGNRVALSIPNTKQTAHHTQTAEFTLAGKIHFCYEARHVLGQDRAAT